MINMWDKVLQQLPKKRPKAKHFSLDLETTTKVFNDSENVRYSRAYAWSGGYKDIFDDRYYLFEKKKGEPDSVLHELFTTLYRFNHVYVYVHNLNNFDWKFIIDYLILEQGYTFLREQQDYRGNLDRVIVWNTQGFTVYNRTRMYSFIDTTAFWQHRLRKLGENLSESTGLNFLKGETPDYETLDDVEARSETQVESDQEYLKQDIRILAEQLKTSKQWKYVEQGYYTRSASSFTEMTDDYVDLNKETYFKPRNRFRMFNKRNLLPWESFEGYEEVKGKQEPIIKEQSKQPEINRLKELYETDYEKFIEKASVYMTDSFEIKYGERWQAWEYDEEVIEDIAGFNERGSSYKKEKQRQYNLKYNMNKWLKKIYRGGMTFVNPDIANKLLELKGQSYDANSMYPGIMVEERLPGKSIGRSTASEEKPLSLDILETETLFIVEFKKIHAITKKGRLPIFKHRADVDDIPDKDKKYYQPLIIFENYGMTSVEYNYLKENYDILELEIKSVSFYEDMPEEEKQKIIDYIESKMTVKETSKGVMRQEAKDDVNMPYGMYAYFGKEVGEYTLDIDLDESGNKMLIKVRTGDKEIGRVQSDVQVGCFITSYGRVKIGTTANEVGLENVFYADTDSLHVREGSWTIETHPTKLGMWAHESDWNAGKFIRPKVYGENIELDDGSHEWDFVISGYNGQNMRIETFGLGSIHTSMEKTEVPYGIILQKKCNFIGGRDRFKPYKKYMENIKFVESEINKLSSYDENYYEKELQLIDLLYDDVWEDVQEKMIREFEKLVFPYTKWITSDERYEEYIERYKSEVKAVNEIEREKSVGLFEEILNGYEEESTV